MKKRTTYRCHLLLVGLIIATLLPSCSEGGTIAEEGPSTGETTGTRLLVKHEVAVTLDSAASRVSYQPSADGALQLAWDAHEALGVYIRQTDGSIIYAGQVTGTGADGSRGERRFSGIVSQKQEGEEYIYVHPFLAGETQGQAARGQIDYTNQAGTLGSTSHLRDFIPLVWNEGNSMVSNQGYAIHLRLTFNEDPGTITQVSLQTMPGIGNTAIFPTSFDASTLTASATMEGEMTLRITSGTAIQDGDLWTADAYIACSHRDVDVFRTKFDAKVVAENGIYYNEFRSFPGQQEATALTGLPMLTNGKCYHLETAVSQGVATTVVNSAYKVNSLLGMWDTYGKTVDPFSLIKNDSEAPAQLKSNILDRKDDALARILSKVSQQGTPTFTWDLLVKQITLNGNTSSQTNVTYNNLLIIKETEVYVTFLSEYGWNQNLLGYYHYPTADGAPASPGNLQKTIIFPNVSKPGHVPFNRDGQDGGANVNPNGPAKNIGDMADAPLQEFTTAQLLYNNPDGTYSTTFPAGTTIGFMTMRDTQANGGSDNSATPLIDWTAWRLFTNTAWNSNNAGWYANCWNYFVSGKVMGTDGNVINGLAIYGVKDDRDHNYDYSFSSMLYLVSSSDASAMTVQVPGALNLGTGDLVK